MITRRHIGVRQLAGLLHTRKRGVTLVETMVCMALLAVVGLGVVGAIIYTRQSMELDKQKIAAMNYCRQMMEVAVSSSSIDASETVTLVPFNAPGLEIAANVTINFYAINNDGTIEPTPLDAPPNEQLTLCRVTVTWTPAGSWGNRNHQVSMQSIVVGSLLAES